MKNIKAHFDKIVEESKRDPKILGFWLDGSRGKGLVTKYSDYDCTMVVRDGAQNRYKKKYEGRGRPDIELRVMSLAEFKKYAAWGSTEGWDRYNYAHQKVLVDNTGGIIQRLIEEKGRIPGNKISEFIQGSLDYYINQSYRSIKCFRDKKIIGARLEAAVSIPPLLDALFALNEGRLKPYYKYLVWELKMYPLKKLPWKMDVFLKMLLKILKSADLKTQQKILIGIERLFRREGYGSVFDGWEEKVLWMEKWRK